MNIGRETLEHLVKSALTSDKVSISRYTQTYYTWNIWFIHGHYTIVVTYIHMDMAIVVYECGRGGKGVYRWTYAYA